ncbi:tyrosine-protein kinase EpsD [Desulfocucumis palustris]|uniref:non-specific protein-tyrosine kinase n=1 Tax=Desulfocucumis palustris TaxID=1898651 RepID=A0A2L2XCG6_9FIRM|nr:CpsD/CapB family tyrosine-protein kinase [Desulfocucumis palustris]GBF33840.1 tyrosine-protein kinase EpsD [Desulfocucumis palustris]
MFRSKNVPTTLITHKNPKSPIAESFRTLRTNLYSTAAEGRVDVLLITSVGPQDGKSAVASNLAVVMAQAGGRVLIVDGDLRNPTMHKLFNLDNSKGLTNLLVQNLDDIKEAVHSTEIDGVWVVPSGPIPPNPSELLGSQKMKALMEKVSLHYDTVILDAPPVIAVTDAAVLAPMVDGVVLVVKADSSRIDMVKEAKLRLEKVNANIVGVVLNEVKMHADDYRYYSYCQDQEKAPKVAIL